MAPLTSAIALEVASDVPSEVAPSLAPVSPPVLTCPIPLLHSPCEDVAMHFSTACPCCSSPLLRQVRQQRVYWFCRSCWQEMPLIEMVAPSSLAIALEMQLQRSKGVGLSTR